MRLKGHKERDALPVLSVLEAWCDFFAALLILHKAQFVTPDVVLLHVRKQPMFPVPLNVIVTAGWNPLSFKTPGRYIVVKNNPPRCGSMLTPRDVFSTVLTEVSTFQANVAGCQFSSCPKCESVGICRGGLASGIGCGCFQAGDLTVNSCSDRMLFACQVANAMLDLA